MPGPALRTKQAPQRWGGPSSAGEGLERGPGTSARARKPVLSLELRKAG